MNRRGISDFDLVTLVLILLLLIAVVAAIAAFLYSEFGSGGSYATSQEAMQEEFSGKIADLEFCSINFIEGGNTVAMFPSMNECGKTHRYCVYTGFNDKCTWRIETSASSTNNGPWYPVFTGRCTCRAGDAG